jgi:IS1 family transposase
MLKKTSRVYICLAVDRNSNEVVDIEVTASRDFGAYLQLALRLETKYKIKILATDSYDAYQKYRIADSQIITKA